MTFVPDLSPRALAFDQVFEETAALASGLNLADFHPEVREVVAALGQAANTLFLPNMIDGVAEVPDSLVGTDRYGFVPLLPGEADISYGVSFAPCTPQRVDRMMAQYAPQGITAERIQQIVSAFAAHAAPFRVPLHELGKDASVSTFDGHIKYQCEVYHMSSRPMITTVANMGANVVLQMLVEAEDLERNFYPPLSDEGVARRSAIAKLRAYHVGYVATGGEQFAEERTRLVERLRGVSMREGHPPFEPSEGFVEYLVRRGFIP